MTLLHDDLASEIPSHFVGRQAAGTNARAAINAKLHGLGRAMKRLVEASLEPLGCFIYVCRGRLPLTKGYGFYRDRCVRRIIGNEGILQIFRTGQELPAGFGVRLDERVVEYPWVLSSLGQYQQGSRFLDAGSTLNHEVIVQHPAVRRHKWSIVTLAPEADCFWDFGISYLYEDLRSLPYRDEWFDAITCVSVLEHVGMDNAAYSEEKSYRENRPKDYLVAVREMQRVLKPGGALFLTVPFGRYEQHGWLQQFDSIMLSALISEFRPQKVKKTFFRYAEQGWKLATEQECEDLSFSSAACGGPVTGREPARFDSDFAAAARGVACVELQK